MSKKVEKFKRGGGTAPKINLKFGFFLDEGVQIFKFFPNVVNVDLTLSRIKRELLYFYN